MKRFILATIIFILLPCFIKPYPQVKVKKEQYFIQPIDNLVFETGRIKESLDSLVTKLEKVE